jgi:glycosyltransferase involved in cell wall biosynthesis
MPKASVIIASYNHAAYLQQAVESALAQTLADLEVIVVDDGSTDSTPQLMERLAQNSRVKSIRQENQGLALARNKGWEAATGEYINFLDADDYFHPEKIQKQAQVLDQNPHYTFSYCDITRVNEHGEMVDDYSIGRERAVLTGNLMPSLIMDGYFPPLAVLMRRTLLEEIGAFTPNLDGHADYDLWLRASGRGKEAFYLDEKLGYYRVLSNSMSNDRAHMSETKTRALIRCAEMFPQAFAESIGALHHINHELFAANQWFQGQLKVLGEGRLRELEEQLKVLTEKEQNHQQQMETAHREKQREMQSLLAELQKRDAVIEKLRRLK